MDFKDRVFKLLGISDVQSYITKYFENKFVLKIDHIDTSVQAENLAKQIIKTPKTYFLQGKWGSGKTEYLKEVERQLKILDDNFKFIFLNLWEPRNKNSFSKKLFKIIYPRLSWFLEFLYWVFIF